LDKQTKDKYMNLSIASIATAVPEPEIKTDEILSIASHKLSSCLVQSIERLNIQKRHSVIQNYPEALLDRKSISFFSDAKKLGADAVRKCMSTSSSSYSDIGLLVAASNTQGRLLPGLASDLLAELNGDISPEIANINMQGQGCSVFVKSLEVASWYLCAHPERKALVVVSEAQTPYMIDKLSADRYFSFREIKTIATDPDNQYKMLRRTESAIQALLFGDGAVALLVDYSDNSPQVLTNSICHLTNECASDADLLVMEEGGSIQPSVENIPQYYMRPDVPRRGCDYAAATVRATLEQSSCPISAPHEATACLIHTGSRKILDGVCERLGLSKSSPQVASAYSVLRNYGNLSGASIGFMLSEGQWSNGIGLMSSFGIGFSSSSCIVRF